MSVFRYRPANPRRRPEAVFRRPAGWICCPIFPAGLPTRGRNPSARTQHTDRAEVLPVLDDGNVYQRGIIHHTHGALRTDDHVNAPILRVGDHVDDLLRLLDDAQHFLHLIRIAELGILEQAVNAADPKPGFVHLPHDLVHGFDGGGDQLRPTAHGFLQLHHDRQSDLTGSQPLQVLVQCRRKLIRDCLRQRTVAVRAQGARFHLPARCDHHENEGPFIQEHYVEPTHIHG